MCVFKTTIIRERGVCAYFVFKIYDPDKSFFITDWINYAATLRNCFLTTYFD